jgi:hypothetical protein
VECANQISAGSARYNYLAECLRHRYRDQQARDRNGLLTGAEAVLVLTDFVANAFVRTMVTMVPDITLTIGFDPRSLVSTSPRKQRWTLKPPI